MQAIMILLGLTRLSSAEVIELSVNGSPSDIERRTGNCTAFRFDVSSLSGKAIERAIIEFEVPNLGQDSFQFEILEMKKDWSDGSASTIRDEDIVEVPSGVWKMNPDELERDPTGRVRFDVTALVRGWASGALTNNGLAIASSRVSTQVLESRLIHARLEVHCLRRN